MSKADNNKVHSPLKRTLKIVLTFTFLLVSTAFYLDLHLYFRPITPDLKRTIVEEIEAAKYPSVSVLVFKEDEILFSKAYGMANIAERRAATEDTLYQIASVSKLVTATALLRLFEQGLFELDDSINDYLPFTVANPNFPETEISFRMLLSHTSSLGDGPAYWDSYTIGESEDPIVPLGHYLQQYFTPEGDYYDEDENFIHAKPGTQLNYTNTGFGLLGYLVERISGLPFEQFCKKQIFAPLNMNKTVWLNRDLDKQISAMPYGYSAWSKQHFPIGYYSFTTYPDGALKTSTIEFMRFLYPFVNQGKTLDGKLFLKAETVKGMLRPQYPEVSNVPALAWAITEDKHMHGGTDPGVGTFVMISQQQRWGAIVFANGGGLPAWRTEMGLEIRDGLFEYFQRYGVEHL